MAEKRAEAEVLLSSHELIHRAVLNTSQIGNRKWKSLQFLT